MEMSIEYILLLLVTGAVAGVINILAGGGSNLTLPALMVIGMPADVANATNRVGVLLQGVIALFGFQKHKKLPVADIGPILLPTLIGSVVGSIAAAYAPEGLLKPLLLGAMISMTLVMIFKPAIVSPPIGTIPFSMKQKPSAWAPLFVAGIYGGFVQAGVGFILIAALAGTLRYDLVRTNALKVACTCAFTLIALAIFIFKDLVLWGPGLVLAAGNMVGAHFGVKFAVKANPSTLKWFLLAMTICGSVAAMLS